MWWADVVALSTWHKFTWRKWYSSIFGLLIGHLMSGALVDIIRSSDKLDGPVEEQLKVLSLASHCSLETKSVNRRKYLAHSRPFFGHFSFGVCRKIFWDETLETFGSSSSGLLRCKTNSWCLLGHINHLQISVQTVNQSILNSLETIKKWQMVPDGVSLEIWQVCSVSVLFPPHLHPLSLSLSL